MTNTPQSVPTFKWLMMREAKEQALDAARYLLGIAPDAGVRFFGHIDQEMNTLCERWAEGFRPLPDEAATLVYSRPAFLHLMRTGQRHRRSSAGVWRILYDVMDTDGDGQPDTLRVLSGRHGAARPLSVEDEDKL